MNEKHFTLPLDPQWRETIKEDRRWSKTSKATEERKAPWLVHPMIHILAHENTEKALTRFVRASKNGLPGHIFGTQETESSTS
jgi:hypothetical protein